MVRGHRRDAALQVERPEEDRNQVRCLDLVRTGELVHQQLAVTVECQLFDVVVPGPGQRSDQAGILCDVVRRAPEETADLELTALALDDNAEAGLAGVAARGAVDPGCGLQSADSSM